MRLRAAHEDEAIGRGHFPDPGSASPDGVERLPKIDVDGVVLGSHEGGLEAEGVAPLAVRIGVKSFVKDRKIDGIKNATRTGQPGCVFRTPGIKRFELAVLAPALVVIAGDEEEETGGGGGDDTEAEP